MERHEMELAEEREKEEIWQCPRCSRRVSVRRTGGASVMDVLNEGSKSASHFWSVTRRKGGSGLTPEMEAWLEELDFG